jgi:hypothetical protein
MFITETKDRDGMYTIRLGFTNQQECYLNEDQIRSVVNHLCKNKPELIREIFCEECPEHTGVVE